MTGVALALSVLIGAIVVTACTCIPEQLLRIFTTSPEIIAEGKAYLGLLKWTFLLFMISNLLIAMLRSVGDSEDFVCYIGSVVDHERLY